MHKHSDKELNDKLYELIHQRLGFVEEYLYRVEIGNMPSQDTDEEEYEAYSNEKLILNDLLHRHGFTLS